MTRRSSTKTDRLHCAPGFVVYTRVGGLPWAPAAPPNEVAPTHPSLAEAEGRIAYLKTFDDPAWRQAEYRVIRLGPAAGEVES